jgi:putative transposase
MPKKKRIWFPGAVYHIMSRGNRRGDIFREEEDYWAYLSILKQTQENFGFILYSYCLMTNHIHLQMQTKDVDIGRIMRNINLFFTKYFNNKYNLVGHLFQGRYMGELITNDAYNLQTSRYIHLNPIKAKMVDKIIDYQWSSYNIFMGKRKSVLVDENKILSYFKDNSRTLYREYVESGLVEDDIYTEMANSLDELESG